MVVSDILAMLEIVCDGVTGYVFHSINTKDLAACLLRVVLDDAKLEQIAKKG